MKIIKITYLKTVVLFFTLCFFQDVYSQSDFRKGFIITNKKDTLNGFIDYRERVKKFSSCDFKSTQNGVVKSYSPNQIKGYGFFNDSYFESKEIKGKNNNIEKTFLEVLVKGKVILYKSKSAYFIEKNNSILRKLTNENKTVFKDGKEFRKNSNRYIGILKILLADCSKLKGDIKKTLLSEKSLTILVENYNACTNEPSISFKSRKKWFKAHFGFSLGIHNSSLKINSNLLPAGTNNFSGEFGGTNSILPSFFVDLSSPRLDEYISFFAEVSFFNSTYNAFDISNTATITERNDVSISLNQVKIPIGFRYTFPEKRYTPYLTLGISSTVNITSESSWIIEKTNNNVVQFSDGLPIEINDSRFGYWASLGVKKHLTDKVSGFIEARFEYSNGSLDVSGPSITYNIPSIQLFIGLIF